MDPLAADFEQCIARGGVVLFPADTVYGLAWDPDNQSARERAYALKGRAPDKPAALMVFAAEALPELPPRTAAAVRSLAPGPLTFVVGELGFRLPDLPRLADVRVAVAQTSANHSGGQDPCRLEDVPAAIREAVDLVIDGGELPGTPSTVVDLTRYEAGGQWTILRAGAVAEEKIATALR